MRRRDLIAGGPAALLAGTADAQSARMPATSAVRLEPTVVDVRRDFGAKGDGITDDWQAIENAGAHLQRLGGGSMYFPSGRYRLPDFGKNITLRSNVEYFGDGHSSVILGSNAAFISPNGASFGRNAYESYTYFPVRDVIAGDRFVTFDTPVDAARFKPGDIIILRAVDAIITPGDVLPYYVEMNRVVGATANLVELEDAIDDGWKGLIAANVTSEVVQGYSIHDLRIECEIGFPFFIEASYKSIIRNCWIRGYGVACFNAFTRSMAHDIIATVVWRPKEKSASLFEIETGSVRANFHDIDVYLHGSAPPEDRYALFYCQEFSRRTLVRNIRVAAAGMDLGIVFQIMSGDHRFENIEVTAKSIDKVLDYSVREPERYQLDHLGLTISNLTIETHDPVNSFNHGYVLYNDYPGGAVRNITIKDSRIKGPADQRERNLIWFYQGRQYDILFDGVSGAGRVEMNASRFSPPGQQNTPELSYPLSNVLLRNCEFERLGSRDMLEHARYTSCRRINSKLPQDVLAAPGTIWSSTTAQSQMRMSLPAEATISCGDRILITLSIWYEATPRPAHLGIRAMGADILAVPLAPYRDQHVDLELALTFSGKTFGSPDRFTVDGSVRINSLPLTSWKPTASPLDLRNANSVEVLAWIDKPAATTDGITVRSAKIAYREVERDF